MGHPAEKRGEFSYADYLGWDDGERWELIDGEAYAMSPAPRVKHQGLSLELALVVGAHVRNTGCRAFIAPTDVRLPEFAGADDARTTTVVQPDLFVVCDRSKIDERGVVGAPDFIVEILSPNSIARDTAVKLDLYERCGVREYWIVDPDAELVVVRVLEASGRYGKPRVLGKADVAQVATLPGLSIDLAAVFQAARL